MGEEIRELFQGKRMIDFLVFISIYRSHLASLKKTFISLIICGILLRAYSREA